VRGLAVARSTRDQMPSGRSGQGSTNVVVAEAERCAWCGRTGACRECEAWDGSSIRYRDPVLCDVCVHLWSVPGAVHDVWYEYGVDYDSVIEAVETAIEQSGEVRLCWETLRPPPAASSDHGSPRDGPDAPPIWHGCGTTPRPLRPTTGLAASPSRAGDAECRRALRLTPFQLRYAASR